VALVGADSDGDGGCPPPGAATPPARWSVKDRGLTVLALLLLAAGAGLVLLALSQFRGLTSPAVPSSVGSVAASPAPSPTSAPTATEPILPPPPTVNLSSSPSTPQTPGITEPPTLTASPLPLTPRASSTPELGTVTRAPRTPTPPSLTQGLLAPRQRLGAGSGSLAIGQELAERLGLGWYLNWTVWPEAFRSSEVAYTPMIRLRGGRIVPDGEQLRSAARAMPGALWLIGNEPDVKWQDNVTPEAYAAAYHHLYTLLKEADPTCVVAIGGMSQPTPLRLRYLDRILAAYEDAYGRSMPVDVWNVHNFILREERDSWGVDIPPGMDAEHGRLFEIDDHDDMELFRQQIIDFRRWMASRTSR
jgi:hypothetical protein